MGSSRGSVGDRGTRIEPGTGCLLTIARTAVHVLAVIALATVAARRVR